MKTKKKVQGVLIGVCLLTWIGVFAAEQEVIPFGPINKYASLLKKFSLVQPDPVPKKLQLPPDFTSVQNTMNTLQFASGHFNGFKSIDRYDQYYQGIPVPGMQVIYHVSPSGSTMVTGSVVNDIEQDVPSIQSILTNKDAEQIVIEENTTAYNVHSTKIIYFNQEISNKAILSFKVSYQAMTAKGSSATGICIIDANTRRIIQEWDPWTRKN